MGERAAECLRQLFCEGTGYRPANPQPHGGDPSTFNAPTGTSTEPYLPPRTKANKNNGAKQRPLLRRRNDAPTAGLLDPRLRQKVPGEHIQRP